MFSTLRTRFGIPGIVATVALVFAMTGGAFAAKYLITSTKQISPSVLKKLKGATGPAGAAGANGAQGAAGPAGAAGAAGEKGANGEKGEKGEKGAAGTNGTNGKSVKVTPATLFECEERGGAIVEEEGGSPVEVCNGKDGKEGKNGEPGKEGSPWTTGGTLPVGATETGTWTFTATEADTEGVYAPISFPIKLAKALKRTAVHFQTEGGFATSCPGFFNTPEAASGHLCVYLNNFDLHNAEFGGGIMKVGSIGEGEGTTGVGAVVYFKKVTGVARGFGTWAVTG